MVARRMRRMFATRMRRVGLQSTCQLLCCKVLHPPTRQRCHERRKRPQGPNEVTRVPERCLGRLARAGCGWRAGRAERLLAFAPAANGLRTQKLLRASPKHSVPLPHAAAGQQRSCSKAGPRGRYQLENERPRRRETAPAPTKPEEGTVAPRDGSRDRRRPRERGRALRPGDDAAAAL